MRAVVIFVNFLSLGIILLIYILLVLLRLIIVFSIIYLTKRINAGALIANNKWLFDLFLYRAMISYSLWRFTFKLAPRLYLRVFQGHEFLFLRGKILWIDWIPFVDSLLSSLSILIVVLYYVFQEHYFISFLKCHVDLIFLPKSTVKDYIFVGSKRFPSCILDLFKAAISKSHIC